MRFARRFLPLLLSVACLLGLSAPPVFARESGFANFQKVAEYADGVFDDVAADDWYRDNVAAVYELGLMQGGGEGSFNASGDIRLSEALVLASLLHSIYWTGVSTFEPGDPWYQPYADYALEHGILLLPAEDYDATLTRGEFVAILFRALPEAALPEINSVADGQIPDVWMDMPNALEIYRFYRAGILAGNDQWGTFEPDTPIRRSAVAAIVTRMAYRSLRVKFELAEIAYPDLPKRPAADDGFFENTAMLGNSLVQGMMLYSGLKSAMSFYCYQGIGVFNPNAEAKALDRLCQGKFDRVYIEFGTNEITAGLSDITEAYGKIIDRIRAAIPGVEVYVMAVTPVTEGRDSGGIWTMARIREVNRALYEMCMEKQCWYIDCCEPLTDETGFMPAEYGGWDASPHMSLAGYSAWEQVIRTHYA